MRHVSMVLCFLVAVLFLTAGTQAAVLVNDTFTDGGRTDGVDALDVDWWEVFDYTLGVSGNQLSIVGDGTSLAVANFPNQVLDSRRPDDFQF